MTNTARVENSRANALQLSTLEVNNLSFSYNKALIFSELSFSLAAGKIAVLMGKNGSGKTTLMRCLAGWLPYKSGEVLLLGEPFDGSSQALRAKVFFVNDSPAFYDDLTAEEHVRFVLAVNKREEHMPLAYENLQKFGLFESRGMLPSSYSRGMRLKLGLVLALTLKPELLLLDEPFGPLDPEARSLLSAELLALAKEGSAVLLSLHQQVDELAIDDCYKLEGGRLFANESLAGILSQAQESASKPEQESIATPRH